MKPNQLIVLRDFITSLLELEKAGEIENVKIFISGDDNCISFKSILQAPDQPEITTNPSKKLKAHEIKAREGADRMSIRRF